VTLAQRLGLAIFALTLGVLLALGLGVRQAWRVAEERSFESSFRQSLAPLRAQLTREASQLPDLVEPLCEDDPLVDSALVGMLASDLNARRTALSLRVPKLSRALALDELTLLTSDGDILGSTDAGIVGRRDPARAAQLSTSVRGSHLRQHAQRLRIEVSCVRRDRARPDSFAGVVAARDLESLLERVGESSGVTLSITPPRPNADLLQQTLTLPELSGLSVTASRSRKPLLSAVEALDTTVLLIGSGTLLTALVITVLLSRGLARPVRQLAEQAQRVVHGDPTPVQASGARELVEAANAFNRAIADLVALRRRLAATERIAARREIARRVAHEIKNPLLPIRAAVETLRRLRARGDTAFDDYFDEATRTVLDEVARITHIVGEFTRFARLPPPSPTLFDPVEAARSVVALHANAGAPVVFHAKPCPALTADRDQLVQVLTNLIQNAQQALGERAGGLIEVRMAPAEPDADKLEIWVVDNGPGVPIELRPQLFEPYVTTKPEGTGLGLAIVERIVLEHGGDIEFNETPGGGATFRVRLPFSGPTLLPEPPAELEASLDRRAPAP
jgi:signal transduction histidine kinase